MSADQIRFEEHLLSPEYRQGEILGHWKRVTTLENDEPGPKWPYSLFWIAVPHRDNNPITGYYLHLYLGNYNIDAPGGCFWDINKNSRLDNSLWPRVTGPFAQGFRTDWTNPHELYAPWDRGGLNAHPDWKQNNAAVSWKSGISKIDYYLTIMYDILNSDNYHGKNG